MCREYAYSKGTAPLLQHKYISVTKALQNQYAGCQAYVNAVPLHAMQAFGGRDDIALTHSRPRQ
jgi:hypothetical protein